MSHHSSDPEQNERMHEMMKKVFGEYPHGKLNENDEGALALAVGQESGAVTLTFPKPVAWIAFTPEQAVDIANALIKHARALGFSKVVTVKV